MINLHIKIFHPNGKSENFVLINPVQIPIINAIEAGSVLYVEVLKEGKKGLKHARNLEKANANKTTTSSARK